MLRRLRACPWDPARPLLRRRTWMSCPAAAGARNRAVLRPVRTIHAGTAGRDATCVLGAGGPPSLAKWTLGRAFQSPVASLPGQATVFRSRLGTRNGDRKSTRLNSSHLVISYAVFC